MGCEECAHIESHPHDKELRAGGLLNINKLPSDDSGLDFIRVGESHRKREILTKKKTKQWIGQTQCQLD